MESYNDYLKHWGILGMHWGDRNGPPYPLGRSQMSAAERRQNKRDSKWAKKNYNKIYNKTVKKSQKELDEAVKDVRQKVPMYGADGKVTRTYMNAFNKRFAEIMNANVGDIPAPSGKVVRFIAKRGELGVHLALADREYDMSQVKNGVYGSGKVAYRKKVVDKV